MNVDVTDDSNRDLIERLLKRPVTGATHAVWALRTEPTLSPSQAGIA
jgi:hypothetical protein